MRYGLFALLFILIGITAHTDKARADETSPGDEIKTIILEQLNAFKQSDAAKAYSYAANAIKAQFPSPQVFFQMVRSGYGPLFSAREIGFGKTIEADEGFYQEVWLSDRNGDSWLGIYRMNQFQGDWKINGVLLKKSQSTAS